MAVTVQGRLVGYEVDGYTTKDGQYRERHTVSLSTGDGVELVDLPQELVPSFANLRGDDAFGTALAFSCSHRIGYRDFQRASVLEARALLNGTE